MEHPDRARSLARAAASLVILLIASWPARGRADHVEFADSFLEDPCASDHWACLGSAVWVAPPDVADACLDPNAIDPLEPCTLYPDEPDVRSFGSYVLLAPGQPDRSGAIFRSDAADWDQVTIAAEVELRDGDLENPASGLCIVIVEGDAAGGPPAAAGAIGDAMGAGGLGERPTMVLQFAANRIGFAQSRHGFAIGPIPLEATAEIDAAFPFHDRAAHPAAPNRWRISLAIHGCKIRVSLKSEDAGFPETLVLDHRIADAEFAPIHGFLGVTAATGDPAAGGGSQNHILHALSTEETADADPGEACHDQSEAHFFRGDVDGDGRLGLSDAVGLLNFLFLSGAEPECGDAADADDDGNLTVSDAIRLLLHLFAGGAPPPSPGPPGPAGCDHDPGSPADSLDCHEYHGCHPEE